MDPKNQTMFTAQMPLFATQKPREMGLPGQAMAPALNPTAPATTGNELPKDIEKKMQDLILMSGDSGPRRWRKTKTDYLKKLESDNAQLKNLIVELQQSISGQQAQNEILRDQLRYFQSCLSQAAPLVFQQNQDDSKK